MSGKVRFGMAVVVLLGLQGALYSALEDETGFESLFDGNNLDKWQGDVKGNSFQDGVLVCKGRNLYTKKEYKDFVLRFEFKLPKGGNNGIGIHAPLEGDVAYKGIESQILDDTADQYAKLHEYQYHGSLYGVVAAKRGFLKPVGEWNEEEITAKGTHYTVKLNGTVIVDADIAPFLEKPTLDGKPHPGLKRTTGYIGLLGHNSAVAFRNMRVKELP